MYYLPFWQPNGKSITHSKADTDNGNISFKTQKISSSIVVLIMPLIKLT
jgi:hypothetical protein